MALKTQSIILHSLGELDRFSSAQEVHAQIIKSKNKVGLSTVYRTLQKLADAQEIDFLRRADGEGIYKLCASEHHHHLLCAHCGTSIEFQSNKFEDLVKSIAKENGFAIVGHDVEIVGYCMGCQKKK